MKLKAPYRLYTVLLNMFHFYDRKFLNLVSISLICKAYTTGLNHSGHITHFILDVCANSLVHAIMSNVAF